MFRCKCECRDTCHHKSSTANYFSGSVESNQQYAHKRKEKIRISQCISCSDLPMEAEHLDMWPKKIISISFQQTCSVQKSSTVALPRVFRSSENFYCLQSVQKSRSIVILSDRCESNRNQHGAPHRSCGSLTRMPRPATGKKSPGEVSARVSMQRARTGSGKAILGLFSQPSETTCPEQFREQRIGDRVRGPDRGAAAAVDEASGEAST